MKLLILLTIIASVYGDKLDRTYLPPANAGSAGGSPGALTAPGLSGFGTTGPSNQKLSGQQPFEQSSIPTSFAQETPVFSQNTFEQTPRQQGSGPLSSKISKPSFGPSSVYGTADYTSRVPTGSKYNQPDSSNTLSNGFADKPSGNVFGTNSPTVAYNQANGQSVLDISSQPERPQAAADRNAEILRYVNENDGDRFTYSFETSNGISAEEAGVATDGVRAQGGYSYTGDDGKAYTITYTADEQGYQPQGEHLPTPHPIPEEILRSIEKNAQAAATGTQEGAYRPEEYESETNSQGFSGAISSNRPQNENQYSNQQYNAPNGRPSTGSVGFQQTSSQRENIPVGQLSFSGQNQPSNIAGPTASSNQGLGSGQAESQRKSGYQYSRPENNQYNSVPKASGQLGALSSQSPQQFVSQLPSNSVVPTTGQAVNTFKSEKRPNYQNVPTNQDSVKPSQVQQYETSNFNGPVNQATGQESQSQQNSPQNGGSLGYQYQPGTFNTGTPNLPAQNRNQEAMKPNIGNQYQQNPANQFNNRPSINKNYQSQSIPTTSGSSAQNGFSRPNVISQNVGNQASTGPNNGNNLSLGFPNSVTKGSAPIQAPYQYKRPSPPFSQNQGLSQSNIRQASGNQAQPTSNQPSFGSQTLKPGFNQPLQNQGLPQSNTRQPSGNQAQTISNQPSFGSQTSKPALQALQNQGSKQPTFNSQNVGQYESNLNNRPSQGQGSSQVPTPTFPSANRPEQFSGPRQPPSFNPDEGYKY